jgi:Na+/H+-dicarboxylate symporter
MRQAASTFTERHLLLTPALSVLALLVFCLLFGLGVATVGVRAVEMTLDLDPSPCSRQQIGTR